MSPGDTNPWPDHQYFHMSEALLQSREQTCILGKMFLVSWEHTFSFRTRSQISVLSLTEQARDGQEAAPGTGFSGQNLRIKYIPCIYTHLWITMPAKSTLFHTKSTCVIELIFMWYHTSRTAFLAYNMYTSAVLCRQVVSKHQASPERAQSARLLEFGYGPLICY